MAGGVAALFPYLQLGVFNIYAPARITMKYCNVQIRGSIVVSISGCHVEDPGSIPGRGVCVYLVWAGL